MKKIIRYSTVLAAAIVLSACSLVEAPTSENESTTTQEVNGGTDATVSETSTQPEEGSQQSMPADSHHSEDEETKTDDFASQIEESIEIEGMEEPIVLNLYNDVDAPFVTYVPDDMVVEELSGGEGDAYFFYANYEGQKIEDIYLQVYLFAEHVKEEPSAEGDGTLATLLEGMEPVPEEQEWYGWSIREYQSSEGSRHAMLGEHNDRYFVMVINSSPLYSEGFVPRTNKIIKHFYWKGTQDYLTKSKRSNLGGLS